MTFEDSNHRVTLSGNEISSILYIMEGYINPSDDYSYDPDFRKDVDNIFEKLEEVADSWEGEFAEPKVTTTRGQMRSRVFFKNGRQFFISLVLGLRLLPFSRGLHNAAFVMKTSLRVKPICLSNFWKFSPDLSP